MAGGSAAGGLGGFAELSAREGIGVLYVLFGDWLARRQMLAALGVEEVDALDDMLAELAEQDEAPADDRAERHRQIEAFVAASGGM